MATTIRPATEADLDILVVMNEVVQRLHAQLYPDDFKSEQNFAEVRNFFAATLKEPKTAIAVAEIAQKPVGYTIFETCSRPENPFRPARSYIYIHQISVNPDARSQGIGGALIRYVQEQASAREIVEIDFDSWAANRQAHRFFEAHGFEAFNLVYRRR